MDPEGPIADIDNDVVYYQNSVSRFPRPHSKYINSIHVLAKTRFMRYRLSQQKEDLDKSILHYTEAIFLPLVSRAGRPFNVVRLLFHLVSALLVRSKDFDQIEDVKYLVEYIRYLQGLPPESFNIPKIDVIAMLIQALGVQVKSGTGDATRNIGEIAIFCRELLTSNISTDFPVAAFTALDQAALAEFVRQRPIPLQDEVIECLRDAVNVCPPGSYEFLFALANQHSIRFFESRSNDDYEDATTLWERILGPSQHGKCPDSIRLVVSSWVTILAIIRSANY
ncbi:hypothetical protein EDB83DRAFT_2679516 [Lactarius deliciosus]|nr:hypothetical protein EDB83DRAFT_2679516 [Lactarius deliciosus]